MRRLRTLKWSNIDWAAVTCLIMLAAGLTFLEADKRQPYAAALLVAALAATVAAYRRRRSDETEQSTILAVAGAIVVLMVLFTYDWHIA